MNEGDSILRKRAAPIAFRGFLRTQWRELGDVSTVLNVTASTMRSQHTRKRAVGDVAEAMEIGADAVAVHANVGSAGEGDMLATLGRVGRDCDQHGMPLLAIMYPRTEGTGEGDSYSYDDLRRSNPEAYAELVAHACRVGCELGADIVKTQFTGTVATFRQVVEACVPVPIVVAGGPVAPAGEVFQLAADALEAGAAGVSFGRNVFSRRRPAAWVEALRMLVHGDASLEAALAHVQ